MMMMSMEVEYESTRGLSIGTCDQRVDLGLGLVWQIDYSFSNL